MKKHDVVIIGGGHNGLIVAAYLAKAKVDVCVVELRDMVGGCVVTRESTLPGFKHDIAGAIHMMIQANPLLHQDELGLKSKYGLRYVSPTRRAQSFSATIVHWSSIKTSTRCMNP